MRPLLFLALAGALTAYAFWVYLRVELPVPVARRLALVRALALVVVLLLLFDPRIPVPGASGAPQRWVLLDASLSMTAEDDDGDRAWDGAVARAEALSGDGWRVARFGGAGPEPWAAGDSAPRLRTSRLLPALETAAEAGAREVRVLSDLRFDDAVAVRAAAERLPLDVTFERFGGATANRGIGRFEVPDIPRPDERPVATVEVHGGATGDSLEVRVLEEDREVARTRIPAPSPGLTASAEVELPAPTGTGRVRYRAELVGPATGDGFPADDAAVSYATVGYEEGGLVLVSFRPDWEVRYLLPVLRETTGLSASAFLRAGADRYVRSGPAADRGPPVDSATVRRAAGEAAVLVLHGLGADAPPWTGALMERGARLLVLPTDPAGARAAGVEVGPAGAGEWYASPDVPTSPIAGALTGVELQGLPPLTDVMRAETPNREPVLQLQLRGAGPPADAFHLVDRPQGRTVVALSSAYWRWAARDEGRDAYRSLWSGLAGWLLGGVRVAGAEPRPEAWVIGAGDPVPWSIPTDSAAVRLVVEGSEGEVVRDTTVAPLGPVRTPPLPADTYRYAFLSEDGDTVAQGRFDVTQSSLEMLPAPAEPALAALPGAASVSGGGDGRPLRTSPLPYLLVIALLCGEWVVRRRSGLR